jgi:hypothetical protein
MQTISREKRSAAMPGWAHHGTAFVFEDIRTALFLWRPCIAEGNIEREWSLVVDARLPSDQPRAMKLACIGHTNPFHDRA